MNDVYILSKQLGEKVAKLHLPLTVFAQEHAVYIDVKVEGPFYGPQRR